jgi:hypothetical protein
MTDIKQMGGSQDGLEQNGDTAVIKGRVPASEISDYMQTLAGYTSGYGRLNVIPCGYDICHNAEEVIGAAAYDPERDTDDPADSVFVNHSGSDIVKWDEAADHMHIQSVLRRRSAQDGGSGYTAQTASAVAEISGTGDVREEARRRMAAEKELRAIFEKTYGPEKKTRYKDNPYGKIVGRHDGAQFYTIGQRKGLNIGGHKDSVFVIETDIPNNIIYVGEGHTHKGLSRSCLRIDPSEVHWIRQDLRMEPGEIRRYRVRIRYRQPLQDATVIMRDNGLYILFDTPQRGITPGQFAVWYDGDEMLGSGVI